MALSLLSFGASAGAQTSPLPSLRTQLGLPAAAPAPLPSLRPPPRALTSLSPASGTWTLPDARPSLPGTPPENRSLTVALSGRLGLLEVRMTDLQTSRDLRWTRVGLSLHNLAARAVTLTGLTVWASGELGSELATLPGLYDQGGAARQVLAAGETLELSVWIALPADGRGDTALRGGERASSLTLGDGGRALNLRLSTRS